MVASAAPAFNTHGDDTAAPRQDFAIVMPVGIPQPCGGPQLPEIFADGFEDEDIE